MENKLKDLAFAIRDPLFARFLFKGLDADPGPLARTGIHEVQNDIAYGFFESKAGDIYMLAHDEGLLPVNAVDQAVRLDTRF